MERLRRCEITSVELTYVLVLAHETRNSSRFYSTKLSLIGILMINTGTYVHRQNTLTQLHTYTCIQ